MRGTSPARMHVLLSTLCVLIGTITVYADVDINDVLAVPDWDHQGSEHHTVDAVAGYLLKEAHGRGDDDILDTESFQSLGEATKQHQMYADSKQDAALHQLDADSKQGAALNRSVAFEPRPRHHKQRNAHDSQNESIADVTSIPELSQVHRPPATHSYTGHLQKIAVAYPSIGFQDFFKEYALKLRPVRIAQADGSVLPLTNATREELDACDKANRAVGASEIKLSAPIACTALVRKLRVPPFVSNDYGQRIRASGPEAQAFADEYPQLITPNSLMYSPPRTVPPFSLHMVLAVHFGTMEVRAFSTDGAMQAFVPHSQPGDGAFPDANNFTLDAWSNDGATSEPQPIENGSVMSTTLGAGDMLFVPHDWMVSWKFSDPGDAAVAFCYVDASNYNAVQAALEAQSTTSVTSRRLLEAFASPDLDRRMDRAPQDLDYQQYTSWPRSKDETADAAVAEEQGEGGESKAARANKGTGRKRKRGSFKEWQMAQRWSYLILGLTIPAPSVAIIKATGRRNATIEWTSAFSRRKDDIGQLGYHIMWRRQSVSDEDVQGNLTVLEADLTREPAVHHPRASQGHDIGLYSFIVQDLQPSTAYTIRVRTFLGEATGPWSSACEPFVTPPYTVPWAPAGVKVDHATVTSSSAPLEITPPYDDGGLAVEKYVVWKRHVDEGFHDDWMLAGNFTATGGNAQPVVVRNLLPDARYTFRVAAANGMGVGPSGSTMPAVKTKTGAHGADGLLHIAGHGHDEAVEPSLHGAAGPVVVLDDTDESVTVKGEQGGVAERKVEVWAAHCSPRHYKVTAEVVWTDPVDASTRQLANSALVRHRIAVTTRGGVPLVHKAAAVQAAGGLGIIIVDQGQCDKFDQFCCPGADKSRGEGLAGSDYADPWRKIRIPVVLMLQSDADSTLLPRLAPLLGGATGQQVPYHDEL